KMSFNAPLQNCISISDLHPSTTHPNVEGVVIGKTDIKGFPDRKNIGSERHTFRFTIKDSPDHFINVFSWGRENFIRALSDSFRIGDCVVIENPLIVTKDVEKEEQFNPSTPSFYKLLVSENHSTVRVCSDIERETRLLSLFHLPVKDSQDFYPLGDIIANGQSLDGKVINILAAVRSVGGPKYFTTADRRKGQRCEVKLFDETVPSFPLICWDNEAIHLAQTWIPIETVLFIADARITFDRFRHSMAATVTSKTIITVNPDTKEANLLFNYAGEFVKTGGLDDPDDLAADGVNLDSIVDVFTVHQLKLRAHENLDGPDSIYGITYAFVTTMNLDSSCSKLIRNRCARCMFLINEETQSCSSITCSESGNPTEAIASFDLLVDLTDHTGTLKSCNLSGTAAEKTLGCTAEEFICLTEGQKTALKWKFLLERCKVYHKVLPAPNSRSGLRVNVLSCTLADPVETGQSFSRSAM
uniref:Meiosis specific with OB-fold n=1 Tax=Lepisosteus oculatus TaxID=7918 RepID=W5MCJ8_LEPOC